MSAHQVCPRCQLELQEERLRVLPVVCNHCGHSQPGIGTAPLPNTEKSDARLMMGLAGALVVVFIFLASSVELRWLQTRDFIGLSSLKSLERLEKICRDLAKPDCVEHALGRQAKLDPARTIRHAEFLMERQKFKEAAQSLKKVATQPKVNPQLLTTFARALAESGRIEEATKYFERVMAGKAPPALEHVETYVKYLARAKRFDQALSVIQRVQASRPRALVSEHRLISEMRAALNNRVVAGKPD